MVARLEIYDNTLYTPQKIPCTLPRKYKDRPCTYLKKNRKKPNGIVLENRRVYYRRTSTHNSVPPDHQRNITPKCNK